MEKSAASFRSGIGRHTNDELRAHTREELWLHWQALRRHRWYRREFERLEAFCVKQVRASDAHGEVINLFKLMRISLRAGRVGADAWASHTPTLRRALKRPSQYVQVRRAIRTAVYRLTHPLTIPELRAFTQRWNVVFPIPPEVDPPVDFLLPHVHDLAIPKFSIGGKRAWVAINLRKPRELIRRVVEAFVDHRIGRGLQPGAVLSHRFDRRRNVLRITFKLESEGKPHRYAQAKKWFLRAIDRLLKRSRVKVSRLRAPDQEAAFRAFDLKAQGLSFTKIRERLSLSDREQAVRLVRKARRMIDAVSPRS